MAQIHRDNGGYLGIDVRETADPYFDDVVLLLQPKAGDTSIVDYSPSGKSITNNGVTLDSTNEKWTGAPSMLFERSNNDDLVLSDSDDWFYDTFDFTIEAWAWFDSLGGNTRYGIYNQHENDNNNVNFYVDNKAGKGLYFKTESGASDIITVEQGSNLTSPVQEWVHLALTRQSDTFRIFKGGSLIALGTDTDAVPNYSGSVHIGQRVETSSYFDGNMTSLRITKGVARYTSNFDPPIRPFPTRRYVSGIIQP
jgi:hypothetical protein